MKKHIAAGAAFAVMASAGIAAAQTSPSLALNMYTSPRVEQGGQDVLLALVALSARNSSSAVQISSVPLSVNFGNGATVSHLSDCRVRDVNAFTTSLNNGANAVGIVAGANTIPLDASFQVNAGATRTLALTCDVSASAPLGGTFDLSVTPSTFAATVVGGTTSVTPTTGLNSNGQSGPTSGTATVVADVTPTAPSIPGVPNTGSDVTQNLILLAMAGAVALLGIILARRIAAAE